MQTISGRVNTIRYRNEENGFTVLTLAVKGKDGTPDRIISATGTLPPVKTETFYSLDGDFEQTKYGPTFKIASWREDRPSDTDGIEKYLASGLIKNIGPAFAKAIVNTFGEKTLEVMDNEPERLAEVKGVGKKRIESIIEAVREQKGIRDIMIWLKRYDIPNGLAAKIYKNYNNNAVAILEENPYRLSDDIGGVGFKKADQVAKLLGITHDSPFRLRSGILAVLKDAATEGHTCLPIHTLTDRACSSDYLNVAPALITEALSDPLIDVVLNDKDEAALPMYNHGEAKIAKRLAALRSTEDLFQEEPDLSGLQKETGIEYSDEQKEAIRLAATGKLLVLTGGPGTGKTATTNAIIKTLEKQNLKVRLAAPTGRAAKRMSEVTGKPSSTIHRMLEYSQGEFTRNEDFPLDEDAFIIDEASMIDTMLMASLLKAIPNKAKVILVGDIDQLPSVGAGCVLRDIIDSGAVPTQRLTHIYRQAASSLIITNAHRINQGLPPLLDSTQSIDFHFLPVEGTQQAQDFIVDLVANQIPRINGIPRRDIQVLCPMRRDWDPIATAQLNIRLQQETNPDGEVIARRGETEFRTGDRVIQNKNDYDKDIFNGDIGTVTGPALPEDKAKEEAVIRIRFNDKEQAFTQKDLANMELAYACTIHKSQGSEYPAVVMPIHDSNFIMLKRNLLYTGVTRAKKLCIIVGTKKAVMTAVSREDTAKRFTNLKEKIQKACA